MKLTTFDLILLIGKMQGLTPPDNYFSPESESLHIFAGAGFRMVMNRNFVIAFDHGKAFDKQNGNDGFYAGIGYLF